MYASGIYDSAYRKPALPGLVTRPPMSPIVRRGGKPFLVQNYSALESALCRFNFFLVCSGFHFLCSIPLPSNVRTGLPGRIDRWLPCLITLSKWNFAVPRELPGAAWYLANQLRVTRPTVTRYVPYHERQILHNHVKLLNLFNIIYVNHTPCVRVQRMLQFPAIIDVAKCI